MKYTTYYEGKQVVDYTNYWQMKEFLCLDNPETENEMTIRKLRFSSEVIHSNVQETSDNVPVFSICMKDEDYDSIYLEKKTRQNSLKYKACVNITKEVCERILNEDIGWMKNHQNELLAEFYAQYTVNDLRKGYVTEFRKETYPYQNNGYVVFTTEIKRALKWDADFFDYKQGMLDCLNCDRVMVQFKQKATIPQVVANVLHINMEQPLELSYSL